MTAGDLPALIRTELPCQAWRVIYIRYLCAAAVLLGTIVLVHNMGAALNPVFRVGAQIKESLKLHRKNLGAPASGTARIAETNAPCRRPALRGYDAEVVRLLKLVGIPAPESRACKPVSTA